MIFKKVAWLASITSVFCFSVRVWVSLKVYFDEPAVILCQFVKTVIVAAEHQREQREKFDENFEDITFFEVEGRVVQRQVQNFGR